MYKKINKKHIYKQLTTTTEQHDTNFLRYTFDVIIIFSLIILLTFLIMDGCCCYLFEYVS